MIMMCEADVPKGLGIENNSMNRRKACVAGSKAYIAPGERGRVRVCLDDFACPIFAILLRTSWQL